MDKNLPSMGMHWKHIEVATGKQPKICFLSFSKNAIMSPLSRIFLGRIEYFTNDPRADDWGGV